MALPPLNLTLADSDSGSATSGYSTNTGPVITRNYGVPYWVVGALAAVVAVYFLAKKR